MRTEPPSPDRAADEASAATVVPTPPAPRRRRAASADRRQSAGGLRRTFSSFGSRNYRFFLAGQVISISGTWMQRVAQDWLILELGGGPIGLSIGLALQSVPYVSVGIWGGLLVDRIGSRKTFLASQLLLCGLALLVGVLVITDHITLPIVYASALAVGLVGVLESPSRQSFVLEITDRDRAANAISLYSSLNNIARLGGPAIAGFLIVWAGTGVAYVINASTYLGIITAVFLMDTARIQPRPRAPARRGQVREAITQCWRVPALRKALLATFLISAFAQNFRVVLPLFATQIFHKGSGAYGTLMSAVAIGAILGALICAHIANPTLTMLVWESFWLGAALLLAAVAPTYLAIVAVMAIAGIGNTSFNTTSNALVALTAEPSMRGRMVSIRTLLNNGATVVGTLIIGVVCDLAGPRIGIAIGGATALLAATLTLNGSGIRLRRRA